MSSAAALAALAGVLAAPALVSVGALLARAAGAMAARRRALPELGRADRGRDAVAELSDANAAARRRARESARALLARLGVRTPQGLGARLAAAGLSHPAAAEQAMALKCSAALGAAIVAAPTGLRAGSAGALVLLGVLPACAFLVPDLVLARRARRRCARLQAEAPELLERVRLGAEAGLSPRAALALSVARADGLLAREVRGALNATELGQPFDAALDALCARCPVPEVRALAAALRRSARHGAPLARVAGALAASSRAERARRIHERAQGAAPKIQLVVALLLVPAALLLVAAALLTGMR